MSPDREAWDKVKEIWSIIDQLRGEPGCPWDRKQTPESVQTYLVEEAHEAAAAIRAGNHGEAAEELGDLLFMVLFMVHLFQETGRFNLGEVAERICAKMIRRHPHVFGDLTVASAGEVRDNWEKIKAEEKRQAGNKAGEPVPESLPALIRAYRLLSRRSQKDSRLNDLDRQLATWRQARQDLERKLERGQRPGADEFGQLLLLLANLARICGIRSEDALHRHLKRTPLLAKTPDRGSGS